ncbi:MAG: hypothetical protein ACR2QO_21560, partial [Acidimicrobiales bacterium]
MADATEVDWDDQHPFGPGSHRRLDDVAEMPSGYPIKGNVGSGDLRVFHRSDSRDYASTRAEVWFDSPTMADAAGFQLSPSHPEGSSNEPFEPGGDEHPCTGQEVEVNRLTAAGITIVPP